MAKQSKTSNLTAFTYNDQNEVINIKNPNQADWKKLSKDEKLSEEFIIKNAAFFDWNSISANQNVTFKIMATFPKKIKWDKIATNPNISADAQLLAKYKGNIDKLTQKETFSEDFIKKYENLWNWSSIFYYQKNFSEKYIREILPKITNTTNQDTLHFIWQGIFTGQQVSEQFLRDFESHTTYYIMRIAERKDLHTLSDQFVEDFKYILRPENIRKTQKSNLSKAFFQKYKDFTLEDFYANTTEAWIEAYPHKNRLDWGHIAEHMKLSEDFMLKYWDKLNDFTYDLGQNQKYSEDFIRKIISQFNYEEDLTHFVKNQNLSQAFLEEYINKIDLNEISYGSIIENLSEDFIRKHQHKWDWSRLGIHSRFDEAFLSEFKDRWNWNWTIAYHRQISEAFLREFKDRFNQDGWRNISERQKLSENFIREFADKLDWYKISKFQALSENFIREFQNKLDWVAIIHHQALSPTFEKEFKIQIDKIRAEHEKMNPYARVYYFAYEADILYAKANSNNDKDLLEKALNFIEKALFIKEKIDKNQEKIDYVNQMDEDHIKVKILMALGREKEAFKIVKAILAKNPKSYWFQEFKYDPSYKVWLNTL